jgi:hypothetical protein
MRDNWFLTLGGSKENVYTQERDSYGGLKEDA